MIPGPFSKRALIFAPTGRDAQLAGKLLAEAQMPYEIVNGLAGLEAGIRSGAGIAVCADEGLYGADLGAIEEWIRQQPPWSDFPIIVLTRRGDHERLGRIQQLSEVLGNVSFLERPFHPMSFVTAVRTAVRARKRQYEARNRFEELGDRQERLRFAQEAGAIGAFELLADTRMLTISEQFCRILGFDTGRESIHLSELVALVEPEDRAKIRTTEPYLPADSLEYTEYRIRRADTHELRWLARRGEALPDTTTGKNRFFGIVYDITDRKRVELELREREAFTRLLINSTSEAFYSIDGHGVTTLCNAAFLQILGLEEAEVVGKNLHQVIHHSRPDGSRYPPEQCPILRSAILGESAVVDSEFFFKRDGTAIPVEYRVAPIVVDNVVQGAICTFSDITERKRADEELKQLNTTLEQQIAKRTRERNRIWRLSEDLMSVWGSDGKFLSLNHAWTSLLGWTQKTLLRRKYFEFVHPDDLATTILKLSKLDQEKSAIRFENRCRKTDGSFVVIAWTAVLAEGQYYAIGRDMTQQRHMEEALRQSAKMEAVGQLTGGIAHDFNNHLQAITAALDMMRWRAESGKPDETGKLATLALDAANKASSLVHRLLAFSRRQALDPKPVNVNELVNSTEELLRRTLGPSIEMLCAFQNDLWTTRCDPNQLESAILNLCINARDAMSAEGKLTIRTRNILVSDETMALGPGEYVCIDIVDSGVGMDAETVSKAFDPFFTTKPLGEGTGLGLSMVYGFARQSEGDVTISSQLGMGTTVSLYLPRFHGSVQNELRRPEHKVERACGGERCVVVVEDESSIRAVAAEILKDMGFVVVEAADGVSGLQAVEAARRIDLLITDIGLPGMDGRTMADKVRKICPDLPVLFMTGYAESTDWAAGFLETGMEMITKPFPLSALANKVQTMLQKQS